MVVTKIRKRDKRIVQFTKSKISDAVYKTTVALGRPNRMLADNIAEKTFSQVNRQFKEKIPSVEDVQEIVEYHLIKSGNADAAKSYMLYRQKHKEIRQIKRLFGVTDTLKLSINAIKVLEARYLLKDENQQVIETPRQMFRRVAHIVAAADKRYGEDANKAKRTFYEMMINLEFLPNSPTLMNAGTRLGQLSACFVLPMPDSIEGIFESVKNTALIHQSGGGTGFSFSKLRPKGDIIMSTKGEASGPVSFIQIIDKTTDVIKQGGKRRGANIAILDAHHPDIIEFIESKTMFKILKNFNISVAASDKFMRAVKGNKKYDIINPRTNENVDRVDAMSIFNLICTNAWKSGDPGMIFMDTINKNNPTPEIDKIESTNPCGELPLLAYESCNLGSINLSKVVKDGRIDWGRLKYLVSEGVHFLDNVIDVTKFPIKEIKKITKANRKIGLGVMGFADMLIQLEMRYDTPEALKLGEKVMKFINDEAKIASERLGKKRGKFPNFKSSNLKRQMRNATVTAIAPTGTISIIAGCSSGIEPLFAISFIRNILEGARLIEVNRQFEKLRFNDELMMKIAKTGSIQKMKEIPAKIRKLFVISHDIKPEFHVKMQAAFQKHCDNSISKTINMPADSTIEDVKKAYMLAYDMKCKGITVYREGSKNGQTLSFGHKLGVMCPECE